MARRSPALSMLRKAGPPAAAIVMMAFFGYYAVLGPNGIFAYRDYQQRLSESQAQYAKLDQRRNELRNRNKQLDPRHANPDMADELIRKELNVVHPDEKIIPLK
ncbi:cell division protein FtsB [Stakelama sediminis]|uniref:Cell division protein FtsB n=1 Tax=Stakelama sediminis TaxID=463200 RepID=A0A840YZM6_9SPHN|nr:septum formation initiator family protein [Stakelama sediminis]MBB5718956.1 cell division protein FtsB [Stakelama sediminis]